MGPRVHSNVADEYGHVIARAEEIALAQIAQITVRHAYHGDTPPPVRIEPASPADLSLAGLRGRTAAGEFGLFLLTGQPRPDTVDVLVFF